MNVDPNPTFATAAQRHSVIHITKTVALTITFKATLSGATQRHVRHATNGGCTHGG